MKKKVHFATDAASMAGVPLRPGQASPLFFNACGATLPLENSTQGTAFLVLNGPSVKSQPIKALTSGIYTMTVNNGARTVRGQSHVVLDGPCRFSLSMWLDPTIQKFVPMTHLGRRLFDNRLLADGQRWAWTKLRVADAPNVVAFRRNDVWRAERFLNEPTINWGSPAENGGGRSVMLASLRILFAMGFRRVCLFGADFHMDGAERYHFDMASNQKSANGNNSTYKVLNQRLKELRPFLEQTGRSVVNCTPNSHLEAFDFEDPAKAREQALAEIGDWTNEKVDGMYEDAEKKKSL